MKAKLDNGDRIQYTCNMTQRTPEISIRSQIPSQMPYGYLRVTGLVFLLVLCCGLFFPASAQANPKYASIVVDAETGKVLRARNANKVLHPASLTKMMTLYMTFEALSSGRLKLSDRVTMSRHAAGMVPSKLNLPVGSSIKVEDAIYALVTKSANDVAAALGEKIAGSEWAFAQKMTSKARALGMKNTTFKNASGLHHKGQVTTARDMAILGRALIYNHPQYYRYFSTKNFSYRGSNYHNHNRLMSSYKGMDGIKTGYIHASGFNLVASAVRDDRRLVAVVLGGRTSKTRNAHMAEIMDEGFLLARKLPKARIASLRVPKPERKPENITAVVLASFKPQTNAVAAEQDNSVEMDALLGQGDVDPGAARRLETGLMAIAAHTGRSASISGVGQFDYKAQDAAETIAKSEKAKPSTWSVQIGAFSSEEVSDHAIYVASRSLPPELRANAISSTVPLTTGARTIYRARLEGFNEHTAQKACAYIRNCMVISP